MRGAGKVMRIIMVKYIHTFRVSSGKVQKLITKVYVCSEKEACEKLMLLGGKLERVKVIETWESN